MRRGDWGLWMMSYTAGLGALEAEMDLLPSIYEREALANADRSGLGVAPAVKLGALDVTWTDTGLDEAVATLFGLPASLLVRQSLTPTVEDDPARKSALARTIQFFDKAADGKPMEIGLAVDSGVDLLNVVDILSADPLWIASRLTFGEKIAEGQSNNTAE